MEPKKYLAMCLWGLLEDKEVTPDELYVILEELATIVNTSNDPIKRLDEMSR